MREMSAKAATDHPLTGPEQLARARNRLGARYRTLNAEVRHELMDLDDERSARLAQDMVEHTEGVDQRVAERLRMLGRAAVNRHLDEMAEVERALERIDAGEYGYCLACGDPISPERLEVRPSAIRCVGCQSRHEVETAAR